MQNNRKINNLSYGTQSYIFELDLNITKPL